jgi:hypothetical protein
VTAKEAARTIAKYFLHGVLYTILTSIFTLVGTLLTLGLVIIGSLLGLIIGLAILSILYGFANSAITRWLWFPVRKGWKTYLVQGFLLGLVIGVIELLPYLAVWGLIGADPSAINVIILVLTYTAFTFINGVIGKRIARIWQVGAGAKRIGPVLGGFTPTPVAQPDPRNPDQLRCPRCHGTRLVVEADGSGYCIDCRRGIHPSLWSAGTG